MPNALITIPQKAVTISRYAAESVIKQIIEATELPTDTTIQFNEKQGTGRQLDTHFKEAEDAIRSKYNNIVFCTYTERYTESDRRRNALRHMHHKIFDDKDAGVYITPIYSEVEVVMELTVRCRDRTALNGWRSRVHLNDGLHRMIDNLVIDYDYELPETVLAFITDLYKFRNQINGAEIGMAEYAKENFPFGIGIRANQNQSHRDLIIKERQEGISGASVDIEYYQEMQDEAGTFEIVFPYRFVYEQVQAVRLYTPSVVYNNILPPHWVKAWCNANGPLTLDRDFNPYDSLHDMFYNPPKDAVNRFDGGTRMLGWDEWFPNLRLGHSRSLTIVPTQVDVNQPQALMNLWDLVDDYLPRGILDYLSEYWAENAAPFLSVVNVEVYELYNSENLIPHTLDADLNLSATHPLNPLYRYMVRVSIRTSMVEVNTAHQQDLLSKATIALPVFKAIDKNAEDVLDIIDDEIQDVSYRDWVLNLPGTDNRYRDGRTYNTKTVAAVKIDATRR